MENQVIHALISTEEYRESPDFMNVNLSDFALFLAVMKHKEAQECVLSIILIIPGALPEIVLRRIILHLCSKLPGIFRQCPGVEPDSAGWTQLLLK